MDAYALNFSRLKRFALALFLVFGGYLFNTSKTYSQKMGKVAYIPRPEPVRGEVSPRYEEPIEIADSDTNFVVEPLKVIKCNANALKGDVLVEPSEELMGELIAEPFVEEDPIVGQVALMGDTVITEEPVVGLAPMVMGMIVMPEMEEETLPVDSILVDSTLREIPKEFSVEESTFVETTEPLKEKIIKPDGSSIKLECYPNPSSGLVNIRYNVRVFGLSSLALYNLNGELVKTLITPQIMHVADYSTQFDISDLADGMYFCKLNSGEKGSTARIILSR